jgi:hypothetical protein
MSESWRVCWRNRRDGSTGHATLHPSNTAAKAAVTRWKQIAPYLDLWVEPLSPLGITIDWSNDKIVDFSVQNSPINPVDVRFNFDWYHLRGNGTGAKFRMVDRSQNNGQPPTIRTCDSLEDAIQRVDCLRSCFWHVNAWIEADQPWAERLVPERYRKKPERTPLFNVMTENARGEAIQISGMMPISEATKSAGTELLSHRGTWISACDPRDADLVPEEWRQKPKPSKPCYVAASWLKEGHMVSIDRIGR